MMILISIIILIFGLFMLNKGSLNRQISSLLNEYNIEKCEETVGTVVSAAYLKGGPKELVTPIVEYKVKNKVYEAHNKTLSLDAELPVGSKVHVWYSKDNPNKAILGSEIINPLPYRLFGMVLVIYSIVLLLLFI